MANRIIFDTETTSVDKPFAYDVGYLIIDEDFVVLDSKHFVIEQVWHNLPLFESAYYKEKRPLYVQLMRARKAVLTKWGYMVSELINDIRKYGVVSAYAFNSDFDERVFEFNCNWYHTRNPFDNVPIFDIMGYSSQFITNKQDYLDFCDEHQLYTDSGNYSGNAENVYRYTVCDPEFSEAHMGLQDAEIEASILHYTISLGAEWDKPYKKVRFCERNIPTPYKVKVNGEMIHEGEYIKKYVRNGVYNFTEKKEETE